MVLPKDTRGKDAAEARHVGLKTGVDDFEGGDVVEPPAPPKRKGLLERFRRPLEENRNPPRY